MQPTETEAVRINEHNELIAHVELPRDVRACPSYGVIDLHPLLDRRTHDVWHLPVAGRATRRKWRKRLLEMAGRATEATPEHQFS